MKLISSALVLLVALAFSAGPASQPLRFRRQSIQTNGRGPRWIAVADVNRDGNPDILVTNAESETITVLLGDGSGQFTPAAGSPFAAGHDPNDIAIADMNGDGNLDLVIPNHQSPYITILLGDGKGGFTPAPGSPFDVHSYPHPHGVAVADFDGDGHLDVMTDSWGNNQVELITGDGRGGLRLPGRFFPTGRRPYERLRSADFNRDGHPDVVTTNLDDNTVSILLGDGHGNFAKSPGSPVAAGDKPWQVWVGDLNGDGVPDLAVIPYQRDLASQAQNAVSVLLGNGRGGFAPAPHSPIPLAGCEGPNSITAGVLGKGRNVIAVSCAESRTLMLYERAAGEYRGQSVPIKGGWGSATLAPLTRAGRTAIITADADAGSITILWPE
jgi:FG-GAP-like repeat